MTHSKRSTLVTLAAPVAAIALGLFAASCVNLTETPISGITDQYYATPTGFTSVVNASYEELRNFYGQERGLTLTAFGTDEFTTGSDGGHKSIGNYDAGLNSDESYFGDSWRGFYNAINTANTAIADTTVPISAALLASRIGEARFLRALYYFDLVRMYGDVPLLLTPTKGPQTVANRDSVSKVYAAIVAHLPYAH